MSLPKENRLVLGNKKYKFLHDKGKSIHSKDLYLIKTTTKKQQPSRFAIIVPKRLDKRATKRNRTKRLLLESINKMLPSVKTGADVIVVAKKIFKKEKLNSVAPIVEEILKRAGLLVV